MPRKKTPKKRTTQQEKAGIVFPVGRVHAQMKKFGCNKVRVGASAAVYLAAVIEYLVAEVLELGGTCCKDLRKKRIIPRHLFLAINNDEELEKVIKATLPQSGTRAFIHRMLIPKHSKMYERFFEQSQQIQSQQHHL